MDLVAAHRQRALSPERPKLRGTAQNPDVFFQAREACNPFYAKCAGIVQKHMDKFAKLAGRQYHLFDYAGAPDADRVIVIMGSGIGVVEETVDKLVAEGQKVGVLKVRLFRPWDFGGLCGRVAEDGQEDCRAGPHEGARRRRRAAVSRRGYGARRRVGRAQNGNGSLPKVIGGRYGLSSKEFTPAMVVAVYEELTKAQPKQQFTVGIIDDVTHLSLDYDPKFSTEKDDVVRAVFFGLGSDGTVSANRNSVKIIGENTPLHAQGYFVYDSRKAGSVTTSHVRFSPRPIKGSYLVHRANFVACHQFHFLERIDMLSMADPGATFLLNSPYSADRGLGPSAGGGAEADHRQEAEVLRGRRFPGGPRRQHGRADQHDHADLLLQAGQRDSARRGHHADQRGDQEDLREEGRREGRRAEQRGGRRGVGGSASR